MQAELGECCEWLYATLRAAGEAIVATDAAGRICFMNPGAENLTGYAEAKVMGCNLDGVLPLLDMQATGGQELVLLKPAGDRVAVIARAAPIRNRAGEIIGGVVTLCDITERKRIEEQLRQSNRKLQQFVHSVSHDLQEPLRAVSIYSELIERKLPDPGPDVAEHLRFIRQGAERMDALLADLRTYSGVTMTVSQEPEETDAKVALQQVMANLSPAIDACGAAVAHGTLPVVPVHGSHLVQLFQNLISNAIKYRRDGHPPTVRIESFREGDRWEFSFADNGSGIEPEYTARIFDFSQRCHGSEIPGSGMGLAICRRIVQLYGGQIWVESTPGEGSTFRFTLPACHD